MTDLIASDAGSAATTIAPSTRRGGILDAAELEFAAFGYDACSLRQVAEKAGVNLGLLHYYFGSKQALFTEVFLRRSEPLVARRGELLAQAEREARGEPVVLEAIVTCFVLPALELVRQGPGQRAFVRLHARLRSDPIPFSQELRRRAFNDGNMRYVDALARACPHLTRTGVVWRFSAMIGAYHFVLSQSARVEDFSFGECDPGDMDGAFGQIVPFVVAGFRAPDAVPGEFVRRSSRILEAASRVQALRP